LSERADLEIVEAELVRLEAELFASVPVRRDEIVRLLDTRYDHLPTPIRRTEASTGFAHTEPARVSCPDCLANDKVMFGCVTCGGRGYTQEKRTRDPYSKSDKVVPYGFDGSRHDATRARDRQIETLATQLRPAIEIDEDKDADAPGRDYAWVSARKRMYARFDYAALDRALEQLHLARPGANPYSDASLLFLDGRMPETIRAPDLEEPEEAQVAQGRVARAAGPVVFQKRDDEIRRAVLEARIPTGAVALTWGISVSQVNRIVADAA
jgi:hypothetical protein